MAASFRLPADVVKGWKDALSAKRSVRGVEPILKEMLDALLKEGEDAHVPLTRHQLFSWAQGLEGIASRVAEPSLRQAADEIRSYLGPPSIVSPRPPLASVADVVPSRARAPGETPPIVYQKATSTAGAGSGLTLLVTSREIAATVGDLVRGARTEIIIVAPWTLGFDSLVKDVLALPPSVAVRVLTRRPATEDSDYHRAIAELRRRNADVVMSTALHTRLVVADGARLLLGAAGVVPGAKETAILTMDAALVGSARDAFAQLVAEARGL